ncbi:MAG: hypothetical protein EXR80_08385 [Methylococcales bacterium]|nr:hypothetical protein [Methylococcales bacterium]
MGNRVDLSHAVEQQLKYNFKPFPYEKVAIEVMNNSQITLNTQDLLLAVFNGTTTLKAIDSDNLRNNLLMEKNIIKIA